MSSETLARVAGALMADGKGLLAIDESIGTCDGRFAALGIPQTGEMRRAWRELLVTTPDLSRSISGVILYDETIRQRTGAGIPFLSVLADAGILAGIKVDIGTTDLAGHPAEKVTEGLDRLGPRLDSYARMGARFAKWRAIFGIGEGLPSRTCVEVNAQGLARYAALCQQSGLVPMVEPEVLMAGTHSIGRCAEVTEAVLHAVFRHLIEQGVALEGMILKPNMVLAGAACQIQPDEGAVADASLSVLSRAVPAAVPGIAFLSGGQSARLATTRLNAMSIRRRGQMPWPLSFSFGRAIQQPALELWKGRVDRARDAQTVLSHRAACDRAARAGTYDVGMEATGHRIHSAAPAA